MFVVHNRALHTKKSPAELRYVFHVCYIKTYENNSLYYLHRPVVQINVYFWGKRADSENHCIFEHMFQKVTMWTHVCKCFGFVWFWAVFSLTSPFPTCAQTYFPNQPWCASMWLNWIWNLVTFTTCFLKGDPGTDDVTDMELLICAK